MKADYILGVCIYNDDPLNYGRIRAIPLNDVLNYSTFGSIKNYLSNQDTKAENQNVYKPWYSVNYEKFKERDPFLCDPFLPKNIVVPPKSGQLIKIINYDDPRVKPEYIGPYSIDQLTLTEEYTNAIINLQKNISVKEVLPKYGKMFLSGFQNEQVILGDNEIIFRLAHVNTDKTRNTTYPFIQLSKFNQGYDVKKETVTITEEVDVPIDYVAQLFIDYTSKTLPEDKNFTGTLILFNGQKQKNTKNKLGLTSKTISNQNSYVDKNSGNYLVKYLINSSDLNDLSTIIENILQSLKTNGVLLYYKTKNQDGSTAPINQIIQSDKHIINIYNNIPNEPNAGGAHDPTNSNLVNGLNNWIFRLAPSTNINNYSSVIDLKNPPNLPSNNINMINYNEYKSLDLYLSKMSNIRKYGSLLNNSNKTSTYEKTIPKSNGTPISANVVYSDKYLFLSSLTSPSLVDNTNYDGIPAQKVAEYFNNTNLNVKTYGWMRGEKMMELLLDIMDMFTRHGHEAGKDPRASITQTTIDDLEKIKKRIKDEINPNQNNVIINHNFRFN